MGFCVERQLYGHCTKPLITLSLQLANFRMEANIEDAPFDRPEGLSHLPTTSTSFD